MSRTRKRKIFECIEYLSVDAPLEKVDYLENKQSKYIHEYVKNKEYMIVGTESRHGFSQGDINRQWNAIVEKIRKKQADGVVIANMEAVSADLPDAFRKVGQIIDAGGIIVTVDEGRLGMNIRRFGNGK
jgi:3-dehydroquinate dehydratase